MKMRIGLVEDDLAIQQSLAAALRLEGYEVAAVSSAEDAMRLSTTNPPQLWILDRMLPGIDGLTFCTSLRESGDSVSVLVVSAMVAVDDKIEGLDAGADDYITKPYELEELLARVRSLLRRSEPSGLLRSGELTVDTTAGVVTVSGSKVELTRTEFALLELLIRNQGKLLSYSEIYQKVWEYQFGPNSKNLAVYISYIRSKIGVAGSLIENVRGTGYRMRIERPR